MLAIGRKHTDEVKYLMSINRIGENNSFLEKHTIETLNRLSYRTIIINYIPVKGLVVEITDLETRVITLHSSVREAGKLLNSDIKTLLRRDVTQLLKG